MSVALSPALDDRENSVSASGSLLLFMEAGVRFAAAVGRTASGLRGLWHGGGSAQAAPGFRLAAIRSYLGPGALDTVAEPPLDVAMAGRDRSDPYQD